MNWRKTMETKIEEIDFREDLYPRFEPNQKKISEYASVINRLPPIKINQDNILIDGYHRLLAHKRQDKDQIKAEVIETESEKKLKQLAYQCNAKHGMQISNKEKEKYAQEMIGEQMDVKELTDTLSVAQSTIKRWTKNQRKAIKEERNRQVVEYYLRGWNSQQDVADKVDYEISRQRVTDIVKKAEKDRIGDFGEKYDFDDSKYPYLYNIWRKGKKDSGDGDHFGIFPQVYMENLLYYHTEPLDLIYDPFAGSGTTVDACKEAFRRYYCSDLNVKPGREKDIRQHDISEGLPEDLPKPDLAFLDPPYWKQAQGKYSDKENDLGNMSLEKFNEKMQELIQSLYRKRIEKIAIVIQPTQYANDFDLVDHIFDLVDMFTSSYNVEMRYILPYSTQQYNAQMVEKAKESKKPLILHRDLVVMKRD